MAIREIKLSSKPYRGLDTDLSGGFPPTTEGFEEGANLVIFKAGTRVLDSVFELQNLDGTLKWYKVG